VVVDDFVPRPEVQARYEQFVQENHGVIHELLLCEVMWNAGGREMVSTMTQVSDILPIVQRLDAKVHRILELLESVVQDRRAYDWAMSNAMAEEHAIAHPDNEVEELPF